MIILQKLEMGSIFGPDDGFPVYTYMVEGRGIGYHHKKVYAMPYVKCVWGFLTSPFCFINLKKSPSPATRVVYRFTAGLNKVYINVYTQYKLSNKYFFLFMNPYM